MHVSIKQQQPEPKPKILSWADIDTSSTCSFFLLDIQSLRVNLEGAAHVCCSTGCNSNVASIACNGPPSLPCCSEGNLCVQHAAEALMQML